MADNVKLISLNKLEDTDVSYRLSYLVFGEIKHFKKKLSEIFFRFDLVNEYKNEINILTNKKNELINNKGLFDSDVLSTFDKIEQLENDLEKIQQNIQGVLDDLDGIKLTHLSNLYLKSLELFLEGKLEEAISILEEDFTQKELSVDQISDIKILKSKLARIKFDYVNAENNLKEAIEISPIFKNYLHTGDYFYSLNNLQKAEEYYNLSLSKCRYDEEKAVVLNNLGSLYAFNNKCSEAREYFLQSFEIYGDLVKNNPKDNISPLSLVLNNLIDVDKDNIKNKNHFAIIKLYLDILINSIRNYLSLTSNELDFNEYKIESHLDTINRALDELKSFSSISYIQDFLNIIDCISALKENEITE